MMVNAYSWYKQGTFEQMTSSYATSNQSCTSDGSDITQHAYCGEDYGTCLDNTLSVWLTDGAVDSVGIPGFDLLNPVGDAYDARVTVNGKSSGTPEAYSESADLFLGLRYGFNQASSFTVPVDSSTLTFKQPSVCNNGGDDPSVTTNLTWESTFEITVLVQNCGEVSGDFFLKVECDDGSTTEISSSVTIAASASGSITWDSISSTCEASAHAAASAGSSTSFDVIVSYDLLELWSTATTVTVAVSPPAPPTRSPTVSPTNLPTYSLPTAQPVTVDYTCTYEELNEVLSASGNTITHNQICYERASGSYVVDVTGSKYYYVLTCTDSTTTLYNCDQDTGASLSTSATATDLVGHDVAFMAYWLEAYAYFGSVTDVSEPVDEIEATIRLIGFDYADYNSEQSSAQLRNKISTDICAFELNGAECDQISVTSLSAGSVIAHLSVTGTVLHPSPEVVRSLRNAVSSVAYDANATANEDAPLNNVDPFFWDLETKTVFTYCPLDITKTLTEDALTATVTWSEPTAKHITGGAVTPVKSSTITHASGDTFEEGAYFIRYSAQYNADHAEPCGFIIKIVSEENGESHTVLSELLENKVVIIGVCVAFGVILACTCCYCRRKSKKDQQDFSAIGMTSPAP
eukprot:UN01923